MQQKVSSPRRTARMHRRPTACGAPTQRNPQHPSPLLSSHLHLSCQTETPTRPHQQRGALSVPKFSTQTSGACQGPRRQTRTGVASRGWPTPNPSNVDVCMVQQPVRRPHRAASCISSRRRCCRPSLACPRRLPASAQASKRASEACAFSRPWDPWDP